MPESRDTSNTAQFVRLLRQHERRLSAYVHAMAPDWATGEDIIQEASVRMWEQFGEYRPDEDFGAWGCAIAKYIVLAARKKAARQKLFFDDELLQLVEDEFEQVSLQQESRLSALAECLRAVRDPQRRLLESVYGSGASIKEVAGKLGLSLQAAYTTLSRVRRALHNCIEKKLSQEAG